VVRANIARQAPVILITHHLSEVSRSRTRSLCSRGRVTLSGPVGQTSVPAWSGPCPEPDRSPHAAAAGRRRPERGPGLRSLQSRKLTDVTFQSRRRDHRLVGLPQRPSTLLRSCSDIRADAASVPVRRRYQPRIRGRDPPWRLPHPRDRAGQAAADKPIVENATLSILRSCLWACCGVRGRQRTRR